MFLHNYKPLYKQKYFFTSSLLFSSFNFLNLQYTFLCMYLFHTPKQNIIWSSSMHQIQNQILDGYLIR